MLVVDRLHELRLPKPERRAAKAEREAEARIRAERDNPYTAERRAAVLEAEIRRSEYYWLISK